MVKHIVLLMMCFVLTQTVTAADKSLASKFRTAVFWNDGTSIVPDETPSGYKRPATYLGSDIVGDFTAGLPDDSLTKAPEIGRSALKLFLTALDDRANYDLLTTLDTADIRAYVEDNKGVVSGASDPVLPNVRIYSIYDSVSLDEIKEDFDGELPEVITVINSGGDLKQSDLDKILIDETLFEACQQEVGVFLLGSASTSFAVAIDKICEKNSIDPYFAVKGIQKAFNVQSYRGSLLFDFDLVGDDTQDSVVLRYDGTKHYINKASKIKFNASTDSYICDTGDVIYEVEGTTIVKNDLHSGIKVTTHWGQFVIEGAKAQSVISYDSYGPDMNSGVNYTSVILGMNSNLELIPLQDIVADVIPAYSGNTIPANTPIKEAGKAKPFGTNVPKAFIKVKNSDGTMGQTVTYKTGGSLVIPGVESYGGAWMPLVKNGELYIYSPTTDDSKPETGTLFYKTGTNTKHISMGIGAKVDGVDVAYAYKFTGNEKVTVWSQDTSWGTKKDSIGYFEVEKIESAPDGYKFTFSSDFVINNSRRFYAGDEFIFQDDYELVYPKSGYSDLNIEMRDISTNGNSEIFKKIFQISALAEDESIPFKKWDNNGRIQCAAEIWAVNEKVDIAQFSDWYGPGGKFDKTKYYFGRFAQQVARGNGEFYALTENAAKNGFDRAPFNALPDDGQDAFKDKEYYTLSVIQHGHQRVAIAGYQPQYIDSIQKSIDIITDLFIWSAVDDSRMPPGFPVILKGSTVYEHGDTIPTNVEKLAVVIDFTKKDEDVYTEGYTFSCDIEYAEGTKTKTLTLADLESKKTVSGERIDTLFFDISTLIDAKQVSKTTLKIANCIVGPDGGNIGMVEQSLPKAALYDIQKLVAEFVGNTTDFLVTADVEVKSETFVAGKGSNASTLPSGTPTIVINHAGNSADEGPSTHKVTISESQTVKAFAKMDGYINSDEITREYKKGSLTFPVPLNSVPEDSILFANDTVGLYVDIANTELETHDAKYKIEWAVEYNGAEVLNGLGEENASIKIAVEDFIDRAKVSVTDFKVTGRTVSQDVANFNTSKDTTYNYNVKKLKTDPDAAANIDFTGLATLTIKGMYDDKEVATSDIIYTFGTTADTINSGESTIEFAKTVDLTFWAEDFAYINSDTVKDYHFEKNELTLPKPKPTVEPADVNGTGKYIFFNDTSVFLTLETFVVEGEIVTADAYTIDYTTNGTNGSMEDTGAVALTLAYIDQLIDGGSTSLQIGAKCVSTDTDLWLHGENMDVREYEFRKVAIELEKVSGEEGDDSLVIKMIAKDPVTGEELKNAEFYYTTDGSAPGKTSTGPVLSGTSVTIGNGLILKAAAFRSGYIHGTGQGIYTKDAIIIADPESGTFFGEKLDVTLTSNMSPIYYTIDGGATQTINDFSGMFTLDSTIATLIMDDDTVKIHAWVDGNEFTNGTQADFEYYRRKLEKVVIYPPTGDYTGDVDVSMSCADGVDYIFYQTGITTDPNIDYVDTFTVTPDIVVVAQAKADGWLPSDTSMVEYTRVARVQNAYYLDDNADGIIDSAVIEIESTFSGIGKPSSIVFELPNGEETVTVSDASLITQDPITGNLGIRIDGFNTILTGFEAGEYVQITGDDYEKGIKTTVTDSVAPVISTARYAPGPKNADGSRAYDILTIEFTEPVEELAIIESNTDQLFMYGNSTKKYTGNLYVDSGDKASYTFYVTSLEGVTYPSNGDSVWINIDAFTPVEDEKTNVQLVRDNRRVPLTVEKLPLDVVVKSYWMKDVVLGGVPAFADVTNPDQIPLEIIAGVDGASGGTFNVDLGGIIIIDPKIPFAREDAINFEAEMAILDAVGNVVITTSAVYDKTNGHFHAMPAYMRFSEDGKMVERWVIAAAWDGRNSSGRLVHARNFKVMTLSKWPGIEEVVKKDGLVPVFKKSEE